MNTKEAAWKGFSLGAGLATTWVVRTALTGLWKARSGGDDPPTNPADRSTGWVAALTWGAALGAGTGVFRVIANRSAAAAWEQATDEPPPGIER
jgi:hypothetical protein